MLRAVIFDLDGVLADACDLHRQAFNQALQEVVGYQIPKDELPKYEGLPTKNKLLILSNAGVVPHGAHEEISALKQEITHGLLHRHIGYSMPVVHMMRRLAHERIKTAVVTNFTEKSARIMMQNLGITDYVKMVVTSEDVQHPKPDPEGLNKAMRMLDVKPDEVIYVGDQTVDGRAAYAAGIDRFICVNSTSEVCWELLRCRVSK